MNPIVFGKADAKFAGLPDFDFFFKALVYFNANVAGPKSMEIYKKMMGMSWGAKVKASIKKTTAKGKIHVKKAGADISAGAKKVGDWFKKAGNTVANGVKKAAKSVADGVNKGAAALKAGVKGGVKLNVKAPSVKVKAGAKVTPKAKVTVKAGAAKKRRLQAPKKPADKPAEKKDAAPVETNMELSKDGLPVADYKGDVELPNPAELEGAKDQEAPNSANLVKLCFMLFAALLTMY